MTETSFLLFTHNQNFGNKQHCDFNNLFRKAKFESAKNEYIQEASIDESMTRNIPFYVSNVKTLCLESRFRSPTSVLHRDKPIVAEKNTFSSAYRTPTWGICALAFIIVKFRQKKKNVFYLRGISIIESLNKKVIWEHVSRFWHFSLI